jgi:redox-sensitive bicupin YhaK (pirin superfamily)
VRIRSAKPSRLALLGGAKTDGDRLIWWNFVASSRELIDAASSRWREQNFPPVPGETEFIPLPER